MNPIAAFTRALLLLAAIAFTERVIFAAHHSDLSADISLWQIATDLFVGLRFDFAVAAILALLAYLAAYLVSRLSRVPFCAVLRRATYVAVTVLVLVQGADLLYFDEAGRHLGYELKEGYNSGGELLLSAINSYTWPVLLQLLLLLLAWAATWFLLPGPDPRARRMFAPARRWYQYFAPEASLLVVLVGAVIVGRGGLQSVPLEPLHAQSLGDSRSAALALNGAYNALFSSFTPYSVERVLNAAPNDEQKALVTALYASAPATSPPPVAGPMPNVVFIFLESWSAAYMAPYGGSLVDTPFFDELRKRSFTTRDMLAGGHRTTEGLFATLCSAQNPLGATVAQTQLQNYTYSCLPKILHGRGYRTAFFQGTVSGTSGTGAFAQMLGFETSYGKEHVPNHRLPYHFWGLHDPDIYEFTLDKLDSLPQPFAIGINTNTTHDKVLPPGAPRPFDESTVEGRYGNMLLYADNALRDFVTALTTRYPNTVLVVLSDHAGPGKGPEVNNYRIPFLIHAPGRVTPTTLDGVATQRDVAPTLLQLLGQPQAPWFTGHSLLEPRPLTADFYQAGDLGWIEGDTGVTIPLRNNGTFTCFNPRGDFGPVACPDSAPAAAQHGLAVTTVLQDLLFQGRLADFRTYRQAP
jgi:phosphoglycerol transferase MdoB-like AlkP superfamily enzyme